MTCLLSRFILCAFHSSIGVTIILLIIIIIIIIIMRLMIGNDDKKNNINTIAAF